MLGCRRGGLIGRDGGMLDFLTVHVDLPAREHVSIYARITMEHHANATSLISDAQKPTYTACSASRL